MLAPHLQRFCTEWLAKAEKYDDSDIDGCCDKFFTLFVVFNRLYAEATFELARRGAIRIQPSRALPDRLGATEYTLCFIGQPVFDELLSGQLAEPVAILAELIENARFNIKLSIPEGVPQRARDLDLLRGLRSRGRAQARAVLDLVYSIRCNLFHGHKAFQQIQVELLRPTTSILCQIIRALQRAHNTDTA